MTMRGRRARVVFVAVMLIQLMRGAAATEVEIADDGETTTIEDEGLKESLRQTFEEGGGAEDMIEKLKAAGITDTNIEPGSRGKITLGDIWNQQLKDAPVFGVKVIGMGEVMRTQRDRRIDESAHPLPLRGFEWPRGDVRHQQVKLWANYGLTFAFCAFISVLVNRGVARERGPDAGAVSAKSLGCALVAAGATGALCSPLVYQAAECTHGTGAWFKDVGIGWECVPGTLFWR